MKWRPLRPDEYFVYRVPREVLEGRGIPEPARRVIDAYNARVARDGLKRLAELGRS